MPGPIVEETLNDLSFKASKSCVILTLSFMFIDILPFYVFMIIFTFINSELSSIELLSNLFLERFPDVQ